MLCRTLITQRSQVQILPPLLPQRPSNRTGSGAFRMHRRGAVTKLVTSALPNAFVCWTLCAPRGAPGTYAG